MQNRDTTTWAGLVLDHPAILLDRTTNEPIRWHTPARGDEPITVNDALQIVPRYARTAEDKKERTRKRAEVFTPIWVTSKMIDYGDDDWRETNGADWKGYIDRTVLEITCGEAPFLVHVYDSAIGAPIPVADRCGILDRKLKAVSEHSRTAEEWTRYALRAVQSVYGYEYQGDSLILARINVLQDVLDWSAAVGIAMPSELLEALIDVITWNIWQMDGLTGNVPGSGVEALIMDWKEHTPITYNSLATAGK